MSDLLKSLAEALSAHSETLSYVLKKGDREVGRYRTWGEACQPVRQRYGITKDIPWDREVVDGKRILFYGVFTITCEGGAK